MPNYILFDDDSWNHLLPLTFTRPVCEIRIGILTIREKWERFLNTSVSFATQAYLEEKFTMVEKDENILINGSVLPDNTLVEKINSMHPDTCLIQDDCLIAARIQGTVKGFLSKKNTLKTFPLESEIIRIDRPWKIFERNGDALRSDFELITKGRKSLPLSETNRVANPGNVFLEEGAQVEFATLNASTGPIYIGKDAEVMEGSIVRGPFSLGEHSALKLGTKIYGPTTIGPHSKVGGEVNNSVIFGFSNKAHDGFLGNAVLGEWCNLGADTNNSNLKNNYEKVKIWSYVEEKFSDTGLQFCGLIMGDHSKSGINTMFNTGTVVGVSANIFGAGFPRNFIPSFTWGGPQGYMNYQLDKAMRTAELVLDRRGLKLSEADRKILLHIYNIGDKFRRF